MRKKHKRKKKLKMVLNIGGEPTIIGEFKKWLEQRTRGYLFDMKPEKRPDPFAIDIDKVIVGAVNDVLVLYVNGERRVYGALPVKKWGDDIDRWKKYKNENGHRFANDRIRRFLIAFEPNRIV